jgi:toxin ParE1/3/4
VAEVELSPAAEADLIDLWIHVAADDPAAADRQLDQFDRIFKLLATQPMMGVDRSRMLQHGVRILRVLHGARDWLAVLDETDASGG